MTFARIWAAGNAAPSAPPTWLSPSCTPLYFAVRRAMAGARQLRDHAVEWRVVEPDVERVSPSALFPPADIDRVRGVEAHTCFEAEKRRIQGGITRHAATCVYKVRGARLCGNYLYVGGARLPVANSSERCLRSGRSPRRVASGMLCSSVFASQYFGHWFTDQLTAELMSGDLAMPAYGSRCQRRYRHEPAIRAATGLAVTKADHVLFEELWLSVDFGQNDFKRARYRRLREQLRRGAQSTKNRGVFVLRHGGGPERSLVNQQLLADQCVARGFEIVDPERDSFERTRDALHDAPVVVGVEGSALVHAVMLMPAWSSLVVLQPPTRFNNVLKDYTDCIGQGYAFTVGDPAGHAFRVPEARLWALLERVQRGRGASKMG